MTAARSTPGISEQASLESACGSIGSTAPGAYTLVARRARLAVERRALGHVRGDVGDVHPHADRTGSAVAGATAVARSPRSPLADAVALGVDGSAEIASSKSRALAGSIVNVGSARRSRRSPGSRLTRSPAARGFALERGVEAAREAAVEQQRLDHVARDVGAPERAHDARAGAARGALHEHEVAGGDAHPPARRSARARA